MENWKDIKGYEGLYQVSNLGNIKSLKKKKHYGRGRYGFQKERILKPGYRNTNYKYKFVYLRKDGKDKKYYIHRLVAQQFLGLEIENLKLHVCHKDDNPENNNIDNLFLGTHKDNMKDMISKGRDKKRGLKGEDNHKSKLTTEEVLQIKLQLKKGYSGYYLSKLYNVSSTVIYNINSGKSWTHI